MDLLEYQGKQLLARHGVPVPDGRVAGTVDEAVEAAEAIGYPCVVKAQVQIGGRGKLGGIKVANDRDEVREHAGAILGMDIRGLRVHEVWIEQASEIEAEYYASIVFDRSAKAPLIMLSTKGGMDIEQVAEAGPGRDRDPARRPAARLSRTSTGGGSRSRPASTPTSCGRSAALLAKLYEAFVREDAMLIEVNPLIVTPERDVRALDAKVTLDGNALFRHPENAALRDPSAEDPQEQMAKERGLTYVKLDGDIGVLGNGAGLVMSTLDVVAQAGGRPANFLDAGGGSKADAIVAAVEVILSDEKVRAVLFNIFGGITRCDEVAKGLIEAFGRVEPEVPFVVRLDGTNDEEGRRLLTEARAARPRGLRDDARGRRARRRARRRHADPPGTMSILVDRDTRLCVSGITGREGTFHALNNKRYGTQVVSGVTPGKAGQDVDGVPVFNTFRRAVAETGANTAMVFVPARFAADSILEAAEAGIATIITITEGIPAHDELRVSSHLGQLDGVRLIGPNCPGVLSPGKANVGIIPAAFFKEGNVGVVSRSGTLTYQIGNELAQRGFGNSSIVGIGGDPVPGSSFIDVLELFEADPETELIVMAGEIGGSAEEEAAAYIADHVSKPVVAYIAGFTAPPGKTMGHAGRDRVGHCRHREGEGGGAGGGGRPRRPHADRGVRHRRRDAGRLTAACWRSNTSALRKGPPRPRCGRAAVRPRSCSAGTAGRTCCSRSSRSRSRSSSRTCHRR